MISYDIKIAYMMLLTGKMPSNMFLDSLRMYAFTNFINKYTTSKYFVYKQ